MKEHNPLSYALRLLKLRERSEHEIREKMKWHGFDPDAIEQVVAKLLGQNFLNDKRFAEVYVRSQLSGKPQGKIRLSVKLKMLGVDPLIIKETLSEYDTTTELAEATKLAERWLERKSNVDPEKKRERLSRHLLSRGFSWEIVSKVLSEIEKPFQ